MHLDDERLQRLMHGELPADAVVAARAHVAACAECGTRLAAAEREEAVVFDALRRLDHATPAVDAAALEARGAASAGWSRWSRRAAGVMIALAATGVAYAAPGSPVPALVRRVAAWVRAPVPAPVDEGQAGITVTPGARFTIAFAQEQERGVVAVSLTEGSDVVARRLGGAARFTSDVDRLVIDNAGATADYEIELPRTASWVEVRVGARRLLVKDGDRVITDAPRDARGRYVVPLSPP